MYAATVESDGRLSNLKPFAERGTESVAADDQGNVYVAAGQVFLFSCNGDLIDYRRSRATVAALIRWN